MSGLDWDAIRARYNARVTWEIAQGLDPIEARAHRAPAQQVARKKPGRKPGVPNPAARGPKRDVNVVARLYADQGLTMSEIARELSMHRETVARYLADLGLRPIGGTRGGPRRRALCGAGLHDMNEHGKPIKNGGRYCGACKRARERKTATTDTTRKQAA